MRKALLIQALILLSLILLGGTGLQAANITISDKLSNGSGWYGAGEDQEVEPGMVANQSWDLEAFLKNGTELKMVGGFNFKDGQSSIYSGDLFIDVHGDAKFGVNAPAVPGGTTNGIQPISNVFGYDYAVKMNLVNNTYSVYALTAGSTLNSTIYRLNDQSNPYNYVPPSGQNPVYTGTLGYTTDLADFAGLTGGSHNQVTFENLFGLIPDAKYLHFTMGCGNDNLMGEVHATPIPGSVLLLASGLLALALLGWRKSRSSSPSH